MAVTVTHSTPSDASFSPAGASAWDAGHIVLGLAAVSTTGAYSDLTGQPTLLSAFTNDVGFITGITSGMVTTALGYTPANAAAVVSSFNGRVGVVTLSSGDVTTALGYTPRQ